METKKEKYFKYLILSLEKDLIVQLKREKNKTLFEFLEKLKTQKIF